MALPEPTNDAERSILGNIREHDCHVYLIGGQGHLPPFAYSLGIQHTFGAPELVIYGLDMDLMHTMVNLYRDRVRDGERFERGRDYEGFLGGDFKVRFEPVEKEHYDDHFGGNRWLYDGNENFEVLQLVWPSTIGPFPCDDDASPDFRDAQPVLFACDCPEGWHPDTEYDPDAIQGSAIVCPHVFDGSRPALYVVHHEDDDWQVLCGENDHGDEAHVAHLHHCVEQDETLREIVDLAPGHEAERDAVGSPWRRAPYDEPEDADEDD